jgi:argininosuccinate lyase
MSRFRKEPDPRFWALNRSIEFDWRLAPYDVDQSQAHARGLREIGVLDDDELAQIDAGLERVRTRMSSHGFEFEEADEDVHMAIERLLGEEVGPLAGKLHTGRSRNDQVATDVAMVVQAHSLRAIELCAGAMEGLLALAEAHRDWPMPGYTHLQRAQPVYLGHHLLAYFWMLARDVLRFQFALDSASVMPLGSGALAGVNWEIDRNAVADDLGFEHVSHNSIDGASNRDFALDYLAAASTCSMHLSRLGSEIVIWSSSEFGFCELDESFSSGSSIMPQKKNPDSAELLRAKSSRVVADYTTLIGVMHALPLTYGKDMQEDKEPLFDAIDTVELCLDATAGMLAGIEFDRERLEDASGDEMLAATEVADLLVRRGVPFREAHGIVGGLVREAVERGMTLSEWAPDELRQRSEHLDEEYYEVLKRSSWLESKRIEGGTGSAPLTAQIGQARETLAGVSRGRPPMSGGRAQRRAEPLGADFFDRSVHAVARDLIGCGLFFAGCGGTIVETESYERDDPACHAYAGLTPRTETLFGPPGRAYVYLSYGIHSLLNAVAEPEGEAAAVLIRALEPTAGIEAMRERRGARADADLCSGPGKLTEALGIGLAQNDARLDREPFLFTAAIEGTRPEVVAGPRIGITKAVERPWRFCAAGSRFVSRPRPAG